MCIRQLFETIFLKLEFLRKIWKIWRLTVCSDVIWNNVLEVGPNENILRARCILALTVTIFWNCWENKNDEWCIVALFQTMFWKYELLRRFWKQGTLNAAFWHFSRTMVAPPPHLPRHACGIQIFFFFKVVMHVMLIALTKKALIFFLAQVLAKCAAPIVLHDSEMKLWHVYSSTSLYCLYVSICHQWIHQILPEQQLMQH